MSFRNQITRAIENSWQIKRFAKKFWILSTDNFIFILHNNYFDWIENSIPLYIPQSMLVLYYNRKKCVFMFNGDFYA